MSTKYQMPRCPNCGARHSGSDGNQYCYACAKRFRQWGMYDYMSSMGRLMYSDVRRAARKAVKEEG